MSLPPVPRLKKRAEFLRVAACQRKCVMPTMIVQLAERSLSGIADQIDLVGLTGLPDLRVGFTASRKVGNAVKRNRARRRLRAVVQQICPAFRFSGQDIVIIARSITGIAPFPALLDHFQQALKRLGVPVS